MKLKESHLRIVSYILVFIIIGIPTIIPLRLPLTIGKETRDTYNEIEKLKEGDIIYISVDTLVSSITETQPGTIAIIQSLFLKGVKIVFFCITIDGMVCYENYIMPYVNKGDTTYGVDYVNLGFFAGTESALAALATNIKSLTAIDYYGNNLGGLPLMEKVNGAKDIKIFIGITGGSTDLYIRQYWAAYHLPIIVVMTATNAVSMYSYYTAGQIDILMGSRGAAEYELLVGRPGLAIIATDALSAGHLLVIIGIISGNIYYLYQKKNKLKSGGR
jgi:hypothetical protein